MYIYAHGSTLRARITWHILDLEHKIENLKTPLKIRTLWENSRKFTSFRQLKFWICGDAGTPPRAMLPWYVLCDALPAIRDVGGRKSGCADVLAHLPSKRLWFFNLFFRLSVACLSLALAFSLYLDISRSRILCVPHSPSLALYICLHTSFTHQSIPSPRIMILEAALRR